MHLILRITGEVARVRHQEFDLLFAQPQRQLFPIALIKTDADRRMRLDKFRQRLGHQQLGRVGAAAEFQLTAGQAVVLGQFVVQRLTARE
ncbi:hypothetical protein D3C86_1774320 [compost metagenome]